MTTAARLDAIVEEFQTTPRDFRLELLLEYAGRVPPLPDYFVEHRERLQRVDECQTPFFVATDIADNHVTLHFDAPPEAPTVRGFAGILLEGLNGGTVDELLAAPPDIGMRLGLQDIVSPLRLRGMGAIVARIKRLLLESPAA